MQVNEASHNAASIEAGLDFSFSKKIVENAQYYGRREARFIKPWYTRKGKVLEKACTISVWKNGEFTLGTAVLAWRGRTENDG